MDLEGVGRGDCFPEAPIRNTLLGCSMRNSQGWVLWCISPTCCFWNEVSFPRLALNQSILGSTSGPLLQHGLNASISRRLIFFTETIMCCMLIAWYIFQGSVKEWAKRNSYDTLLTITLSRYHAGLFWCSGVLLVILGNLLRIDGIPNPMRLQKRGEPRDFSSQKRLANDWRQKGLRKKEIVHT